MSNSTQEKAPNDYIEQEFTDSRAIADISGSNSAECAAAWDAVEELQAEAKKQIKSKNSLEQYLEDNPDADESELDQD